MNIKRLMHKLNHVSSQYIGKIMYTLFLMSILETLVSFAIFSPALSAAQGGAGDFASRAFALVLGFAAVCAWFTFQFGFSVMLLRMTRNQSVNLGYIFIGFKKFNPAGKVTAAFAAIVSVLALVSGIAAKLIFARLKPGFSAEAPALPDLQLLEEQPELLSGIASDTLLFLALFLVILLVLSLAVLIRFAFVFQLHFDEPSLSVPQLFKKSNRLMRKNALRLILFALRAGGRYLLIAIFLAASANFIPAQKSPAVSVLVFLIDIAYFINFYTALVRIYLTVPVLYEELYHPVQ